MLKKTGSCLVSLFNIEVAWVIL